MRPHSMHSRASLLSFPRPAVICEYPLKELYDFHVARGAEGTIFVTKACTQRILHSTHRAVRQRSLASLGASALKAALSPHHAGLLDSPPSRLQVEEPSKYGVVMFNEDTGKVRLRMPRRPPYRTPDRTALPLRSPAPQLRWEELQLGMWAVTGVGRFQPSMITALNRNDMHCHRPDQGRPF